jgi:hypothetical protein
MIGGRVLNEVTHQSIAGARVILTAETDEPGTRHTETDQDGHFSFASLDAATYDLKVAADKYRPSELRGLVLPVSGMLIQTVTLRYLADLWQAGLSRSVFAGSQSSVLPVYGPDVDLSRSAYVERAPAIRTEIAPSLSRAVTRDEIANLPLAGRDPYTLVVLQPNVTNDVSTLRGLGVSANGQRPSSTAFLLDGFQNNSYLATGVFAVVPPEAIQQYRLSLNNFSAEFGGTSGYLANVVTRSGTDRWNAQLYADFTNQTWNAIDSQEKANGGPAPSQQFSVGTIIGGAFVRDRVFTTTSFVFDRSSGSSPPYLFTLPTQTLLTALQHSSASPGVLYRNFHAPVAPGLSGFGQLSLRPSVTVSHVNGFERIDFVPSNDRIRSFARLVVDRFMQPDFIWSPYPDFRSGLDRNLIGMGWSTTFLPSPAQSYEFRAGFTPDSFAWHRAHAEIPTLSTSTRMTGVDDSMIGSPASYSFENGGKTLELSGNATFTTGSHAVRWGGSYLRRSLDSDISAVPAANYSYESAESLVSGHPSILAFPVSRSALSSGAVTLPDTSRSYRYWQVAGYLEDSYRMSDRLLINAGLRYEFFSPPMNTGAVQDAIIRLGSGSSLPERIPTMSFVNAKTIYDADAANWAPRIGFSYNLRGQGDLVLRGTYGIFYDRPFDNVWLNVSRNDSLPASAGISHFPLDPLKGTTANLQLLFPTGVSPADSCSSPVPFTLDCLSADQTLFQPGLRSPYVQSLFAGLQKRTGSSVSMELDYASSLGRQLLTTDIINREVNGPRPNNRFGDVNYRANQGDSTHHALIASLAVRRPQFLLALNYTWSHTIDNQSEPLAGFTLNLATASIFSRSISPHQAAFTRQFDSSFDRGNSNFDQRHVFSTYFTWFLPRWSGAPGLDPLLRNWICAGLASIRSGSPYIVYAAADTGKGLFNNRSNLLDPTNAPLDQPYTGGKIILNRNAFAEPAAGVPGTSGRNAFYGPGAYNLDLSIGRTFILRENLRLTVRADAFNLFNHANLNNPVSPSNACCAPNQNPPFGLTLYGRGGNNLGLPLSLPLAETARQLHFIVRLTF